MTESSLQTRCPECETRFRVTDEQLSVAKGKVRCGNCMAVFNAVEHKVKASPATPSAGSREKVSEPPDEDEPATSSAETEADPEFSADDFVFADNPEEDASEEQYAGSKLTFSEEELSDSFRSIDEEDEPDFRESDRDEIRKKVDESWAEAMLDDEPDKPETPASIPPPKPPREQRPEPQPSEETPSFDGNEWPLESERKAPQAEKENPWQLDDDQLIPQSDQQQEAGDLGQDPIPTQAPWAGLQRDPVTAYHKRHKERGRFRTVIWSLVALFLAGTLVAQVTWFQFDRLSAIPELRPFYEKACGIVGCELAPLVQVSQIESRKLVVRTNPQDRKQLLVDAVILNQADFEQPFPAIALTFSNLNGDVVAQSIFLPEDYLKGDGESLDAMPPNTPVRIAISIRDPGKDAVNYNMAFRPHVPES